MPAHELTLRVWRGDQDGGEFVTYRVEGQEGEVVLDVIHRLQATQANDLAVRWNCKAGKCGSCSAEINGRPRLMCMTRLSTLNLAEPITVTPMRTFPVVRDLVTDVSYNYEMAKRVPPFTPAGDNSGGKYRMQPRDVDRIQEFHKCIECFLCQNVCHVVRDHEENKQVFAGPRFFIRYAGLDMHPLDTLDRRATLQDDFGLGMCNITKCCTEVCPEGIHITDNAIIPMKERVVDKQYDPVVWLGNKIGIRSRTPREQVGPYRAPSTSEDYAKAALGLAPPPVGTDPAPNTTPPVDEALDGKVANLPAMPPTLPRSATRGAGAAATPAGGRQGALASGHGGAHADAGSSLSAKDVAPAAAAAGGLAALIAVILRRRR
jgi:succinate dehydrogenase / fumarate reductase iron-sulfur subunit